MADLPPDRCSELLALTSHAPLGPASSLATEVGLFAFESVEWAGAWWETLTWRPLSHFTLARGQQLPNEHRNGLA